MATQANTVSDVRAAQVEAMEKKAEAENKTRTGKGTRIRVGQTRGKNPQVITWEAFDLGLPDTLPKTPTEFLELTKTSDDAKILSYLLDGFNDAMYSAASDPIAEFVNPAWDDEMQGKFRITIRNYAANAGVSLEDAVALIKPGIEKAHLAKVEAAKAAKTEPAKTEPATPPVAPATV
jgi:hypothetical protein